MSLVDDATAARGEELAFAQKAEPNSYVGLSFKNWLLNIVTLTLYRFWGKTAVRRRLWNSTYLNGEPFEYTGRGLELFLGFLFAILLVTLPLLLIIFGAQFLGAAGAALTVVLADLGLIVLLGFGRFAAFRYLASRTVWRGVRFQLTGGALRYGFKFLGYMLLVLVSFGWFLPAAQRRLAAPLWGGLRFGDRPLSFSLPDARKSKIYGAFARLWVGGLIAYFVWIAVIMRFMPGIASAAGGEPTLREIGAIYASVLILGVFLMLLYAPYHAALLRSVVSGIKFDDARFRIDLSWSDLLVLTLSNIAYLTVSLGILMPFVEARTARFLVSRIRSTGLADLESACQAPAGPRTGEGLADAFGVVTV